MTLNYKLPSELLQEVEQLKSQRDELLEFVERALERDLMKAYAQELINKIK